MRQRISGNCGELEGKHDTQFSCPVGTWIQYFHIPEFSSKLQNLYLHMKFSTFYILTTIMLLLLLWMLWVPNEIKCRLLASKFNSSIYSCKKYLLSYYCYIPDRILINKEKNSEQNKQHICPHGAYCPRSTHRATQFMVVLLMYLFIKVDKNRGFQRDNL